MQKPRAAVGRASKTPERSRTEEILARLEHSGIRLGLDRIKDCLGPLGDPQLAIPVVLVAGTNGKGSTAALLAAMSQAAGYRTGLFTSPHLEQVHERIRIDGVAIADRRLTDYLETLLELVARFGIEPPTYFEALTLTAFCAFRDSQVDLAVLEIGLGGRLDATNVSEPRLSLITSIHLDHERQLGSSFASVAREKAGIFRPGRPALAWGDPPEARSVFEERALEIQTILGLAEEMIEIEPRSDPQALPQRALFATRKSQYDAAIALPGRHQLRNLALAILAAEHLADDGFPRLDHTAIIRGASDCRWPGRLEWISLSDGRRILLDAAHNPAGATTLAGYLTSLDEDFDLLFGAVTGKRVKQMLPALAARARRLTLTRPPDPRGAEPHAWTELLPDRAIAIEPDVERALTAALDACHDRPLVVCGSIFLIGYVRRRLHQLFGIPPKAAERLS